MKSLSRRPSRSEQVRAAVFTVASALTLATACVLPTWAQAPEASGYAVVTSPDVKETLVSRADAVRLLLGQKRFWPSGARVVVLVPASGSAERRFLLGSMCRMTEAAYRRHTLEQLYRGELEYAPKVVDDEYDALEFLTASHGAVTLVSARVALKANAHILKVDGKLPGEPGYGLVP